MLTCFKNFLGYLQLRSFNVKNINAINTYTEVICIGNTCAGDIYIKKTCIKDFYIKDAYYAKILII